ncbi:organic cation transporter protein-like [Galleria mellonella]|uniref:Organic cation transporter protein-like n=1 Tax=Galleria mellonella TaxID=7137 RepID=A0A6J1X5J2_GALME|nr:organic cation transporter protein-like [Galleria mellonella]
MSEKYKPSESEPEIAFEDVLNAEIGQFGKYQIINLLLLTIPSMASAFMAADYIFTAARLPHRCAIPECDGSQPIYEPAWLENAIPFDSSGFDDCNRYASIVNITELTDNCPAELFDKNTTIPCESYVFLKTNSVVYDFDLACKEWLRALAGTLNSLGAMIALPLAGYISDHFGRRVSIVFFAFNLALTGFIRSFSVNYTMYVTFQFLQTAIGGGVFSAAYILAAEIVGPKFRVLTSATMSSLFGFGQVLVGLIASAIHEWRHFSLTISTPVFLLVSYYWIVTESYRWLLSKNKQDEARATLEKAARLNRRTISEKTMNYLLTAIPKQIEESKRTDKDENLFLRVIKSKVMLRRCCTTPIMWITTTFIYYGLSINSVSLSGNMYINYIAVVAIEIPGFWTAVLILDRIGRRITIFGGYFLCGLCCIGFAFTPRDMHGLSMFLFLFGKYCTGLVFTSLYLYTSELYPTRHRHSFLGFSSMVGRVGSVLAPLTPPLAVYWTGIPSMLFGIMSIIAAILVLTQPETHGLKVPDTFEDAEQLGKS